MTYLDFHLLFLVGPTLVLATLAWRQRHFLGSRVPAALFAVSPIAVLYTARWDQILIRERVWWYGDDRVIGAFMGVPYEEYLFMAVQPIMTGALLLWLLSRRGRRGQGEASRPSAAIGAARDGGQDGNGGRLAGPGLAGLWVERLGVGGGIIAVGLAIGVPALGTEPGTYLGLLLVWAAPALGALVAAAWPGLRAFPVESAAAWTIATLYLSAADRITIGAEVWTISPTLSTGIHILGLPLEEALFFAVTNGLVVAGAMLFLLPGLAEREGPPFRSGRRSPD